MEEFFISHNIPTYLARLLELMGVSTIKDLLLVDGPFLDSLQKCVQDGAFDSYVDFGCRQKRLLYFGFDLASPKTFVLRPIDRMKLLKLPELAQLELDKPKSVKIVKYVFDLENQSFDIIWLIILGNVHRHKAQHKAQHKSQVSRPKPRKIRA